MIQSILSFIRVIRPSERVQVRGGEGEGGGREGEGEKVKDKRNRHVAADIHIPVVAVCRFVDRS